MNESQVQATLLKNLNNHGWFYNTNDRFRAGIPDILGTYQSRFIAIEVKVDKTPVTPLQIHELKQIIDAGGLGLVVRYLNNTKKYTINELLLKKTEEIVECILKLSRMNIRKSVSTS